MLVPAVVEELVPAVEGGPLRLEDHQALFLEAKTTAVRGWRVRFGSANQGPGDGEVPVLHHPLFLETPDEGAEAGGVFLAGGLEVLLVISKPDFSLRLCQPQVGLHWGLLHHRHPSGLDRHRGTVDDALGQALTAQGALPSHPGLLGAAIYIGLKHK